jgi:mRNA interferase RelE/StbE
MKILFESSFDKDIRKLINKEIKLALLQIIASAKTAKSLREIKNLKKLRSIGSYYRIKIGDYRVGVEYDSNTIIFVRCLHRKDIYKYFP